MPKSKKHLDSCTQVDHHLSMRRRIGRADFSFIDHIVVFSGPIIPIAIFIQAYSVWVLEQTAGLSVITWSLLLIASFTMAIYAVYHRTRPLIVTYVPLTIANGLVVLGILIV